MNMREEWTKMLFIAKSNKAIAEDFLWSLPIDSPLCSGVSRRIDKLKRQVLRFGQAANGVGK